MSEHKALFWHAVALFPLVGPHCDARSWSADQQYSVALFPLVGPHCDPCRRSGKTNRGRRTLPTCWASLRLLPGESIFDPAGRSLPTRWASLQPLLRLFRSVRITSPPSHLMGLTATVANRSKTAFAQVPAFPRDGPRCGLIDLAVPPRPRREASAALVGADRVDRSRRANLTLPTRHGHAASLASAIERRR